MRDRRIVASPGGDRWRARRRALGALAAAAVAVIWLAAASPAAAAPGSSAHASLIGGRTASIAELPAAAFVTGGRGGGKFSCSGTVIAPRVVLTAAHCVDNVETLAKRRVVDFRVTTGVANVRRPPSSAVLRVTAALAYPGFDPSRLLGDAGLLVLSRPVAAVPISLASPAAPVPLEAGTQLQVAGWGLTDVDRFPAPDLLHSAEIAAQSAAYCRSHSREINLFFSASLQICAVAVPE